MAFCVCRRICFHKKTAARIEAADNEAQLAAWMRNEFSHVALRHGITMPPKQCWLKPVWEASAQFSETARGGAF